MGGTTRCVAVSAVLVVVSGIVTGCGRQEAPGGEARDLGGAGSGERAKEQVGMAWTDRAMEEREAAAGQGAEEGESAEKERKEPAAAFLPPGFLTWKQYDETYAKFRAERVRAQERLPFNADGSRVWLGQIVFAHRELDEQVKTFGMARQMVKQNAMCEFMKMDGTRVKFSEAGIGEAIGKVAAKKYVKVFGWLDEEAGTIKPIYIDVAGDKYVWKDGELVKN